MILFRLKYLTFIFIFIFNLLNQIGNKNTKNYMSIEM